MDYIDSKLKDEPYLRHFLSEKNLFIVDFLSQKTQEVKSGFSKVAGKAKTKRTNFQKKRNWHRIRDEVEKKRKLRSKVSLGRSQVKEKQKQVHRIRSSKRAKQRQRIWSSWRFANHMVHNRDLKPSTEIQTSWKTTHQFNNVELGKVNYELSRIQTTELERRGTIQQYNRMYDQVGPKRPAPIKPELRNIYVIPTIRPVHDIVLIKYARLEQPNSPNVFVSSKVLALMMACCRSVQSWDVKLTKRNGKIFLDHDVPSRVTMISVDERAKYPPSLNERYKKNLNSAFNLERERTMLNRVFQVQIVKPKLDPSTGRELKKNFRVFGDDIVKMKKRGKKLHGVGYLYKQFTLPTVASDMSNLGTQIDDLRVVVRCEVDSLIGNELCVNRAVHQYRLTEDGKNITGGMTAEPGVQKLRGWSRDLLTTPGTIIVNQVNYNSFEFTRWIFEALLAGAKYLQIGFLSRKNFKSNSEHEILDVERYDTIDLAKQFNVKLSNGWAIFRRIVQSVMVLKDGDYLLMKIPNKQCLEAFRMSKGSNKKKIIDE